MFLEIYQGSIGHARTYVPLDVCPQTWLNEARTSIGLSPTLGFLNETDTYGLIYFEILRELSSGLF